MRIVCPICSAAYEVRDDLLVPGRAVRCARCSEQWVAIEAAPALPTPPSRRPEPPAPKRRGASAPPNQPRAASPRLTAMDRLASQPVAVPRTSPGLRAAWAASFVVLLLSGWGIVAWRADLMRVWPPSARLYDAIGLAPAHATGALSGRPVRMAKAAAPVALGGHATDRSHVDRPPITGAATGRATPPRRTAPGVATGRYRRAPPRRTTRRSGGRRCRSASRIPGATACPWRSPAPARPACATTRTASMVPSGAVPSTTSPGASRSTPWLCSEFTAISVVPASPCSQPPGVMRIAVRLALPHLHRGLHRRGVVDPVGQVLQPLVQRAAHRDVQFLEAAADRQQRHAARHGGADQRQGGAVARRVLPGALGMRRAVIIAGMHVGAAAGQDDAVQPLQQGFDVAGRAVGGEQDRDAAAPFRRWRARRCSRRRGSACRRHRTVSCSSLCRSTA